MLLAVDFTDKNGTLFTVYIDADNEELEDLLYSTVEQASILLEHHLIDEYGVDSGLTVASAQRNKDEFIKYIADRYESRSWEAFWEYEDAC